MGKFKEEHGKSRIAVFLEKTAPDLLDAVGSVTGLKAFSMLGDLIGGSDQLTPEQKTEAKDLLLADIQQEQERTERHTADMASDSWLSKNIRPMTLIFLLLIITILAVWDSASINFDVKEGYVGLFEQLLITAFGFYFVLRGVEKMVITKKTQK